MATTTRQKISRALDRGLSPSQTARLLLRIAAPSPAGRIRMGFRVEGSKRWFPTRKAAEQSGLTGKIIDVTREERNERRDKRGSNDTVSAATKSLERYREVQRAAGSRGDNWRPFEVTMRDGRKVVLNAVRPVGTADRTDGLITFEPGGTGNAKIEIVSPSRFGDDHRSIRPDYILGAARDVALHELAHLDDAEIHDEGDYRQQYLESVDGLDRVVDDAKIERLYRQQPFELRANERAVIAAIMDDWEKSDRRESPARFAEDWLVDRDGLPIVQAYYDGLTHTDRGQAARLIAANAAAAIAKRHKLPTGRLTPKVHDPWTDKQISKGA